MTIPVDAPDTIKSLSAILAATSAWSAIASAADIYWPAEETGLISGTFAVLTEGSDSHNVDIYSNDLSDGAMVQLAESLRFQLRWRNRTDGTGLYIAPDIQYERFSEASDAQIAGDGFARKGITLFLTTGLSTE